MRRFILASTILGMVLAAAPARAATACLSPAEAPVIAMRSLQNHFMVAALACNQQQDYNNFARMHDALLVYMGGQLHAVFERRYGAASETRLNAYVTRLANDASQQVVTGGYGYCKRVWDLFGVALESPSDNVVELAMAQPDAFVGFTPCANLAAK